VVDSNPEEDIPPDDCIEKRPDRAGRGGGWTVFRAGCARGCSGRKYVVEKGWKKRGYRGDGAILRGATQRLAERMENRLWKTEEGRDGCTNASKRGGSKYKLCLMSRGGDDILEGIGSGGKRGGSVALGTVQPRSGEETRTVWVSPPYRDPLVIETECKKWVK